MSQKSDFVLRVRSDERDHHDLFLASLEAIDRIDLEVFGRPIEFVLDAVDLINVRRDDRHLAGIDRFVQQVADFDNIKEAVLFPRNPDRLTP